MGELNTNQGKKSEGELGDFRPRLYASDYSETSSFSARHASFPKP